MNKQIRPLAAYKKQNPRLCKTGFEFAEIDENLQRSDLDVFERSKWLNERKRIYEKLYPKTKQGAFNKSNNYGRDLETAESALTKHRASMQLIDLLRLMRLALGN